jgi:uncharacterized protein
MNPPPTTWKRRVRRTFVTIAVVYIGFVAFLMVFEDFFVFMPGSSANWHEPNGFHAEDVTLTSADGTSIHAWWIPCEDGDGAILFCHGQMGNLSTRGFLMKRLLRLKKSILLFDYPGFGKSEGDPSEQGCYDAADAAYDWLLDEQKIPAERIVIMGKSLGSGIATDLASRRANHALVLVMALTSTPDVAAHLMPFVPAHWIMRNRFDNLSKIGRCKGAVFLSHGCHDRKIPCRHSELLYEAAPEPKKIHLCDGVGHDLRCLADDCLDEIDAFLRATRK